MTGDLNYLYRNHLTGQPYQQEPANYNFNKQFNIFATPTTCRWEKEGAKSWNYQNCLPYFKKAQAHEFGSDDYRGGDGPLNVSRGVSGNLLHEVFIEAATQAGHPRTEDVNGYQQEGFGIPYNYNTNNFRTELNKLQGCLIFIGEGFQG